MTGCRPYLVGGEGRGGKITLRNWPEGKAKLAARCAVCCHLMPSLSSPDSLRRVRGRGDPRGDSEGVGPGAHAFAYLAS